MQHLIFITHARVKNGQHILVGFSYFICIYQKKQYLGAEMR